MKRFWTIAIGLGVVVAIILGLVGLVVNIKQSSEIDELKSAWEQFYTQKYDGQYDNSADLVKQEDIDALMSAVTEVIAKYRVNFQIINTSTGTIIAQGWRTDYIAGTGTFWNDKYILTAGHLILKDGLYEDYAGGLLFRDYVTLQEIFFFNGNTKVTVQKIFSSFGEDQVDVAVLQLPSGIDVPDFKVAMGKTADLSYGDFIYQIGMNYQFIDNVSSESDLKNTHPYLLDGIVGSADISFIDKPLGMPWCVNNLFCSTDNSWEGFSGGPALGLRDGKPELVGINSGGINAGLGFVTKIEAIKTALEGAGIHLF